MSNNAAISRPAGPFPWMTRDEVFHIETPKLWLRWPRLADAPILQAIASHASVAGMTATWQHPLPEGEAARRIASARGLNASGEGLVLALTAKGAPNRLIGMIGCNALAAEHLGVGYLLDPEYAGRGLATQALRGFVHALFTFTGLRGISASSRVINPASRRVLEKNGFTHLDRGMLDTDQRGTVEVDFFELTRESWKQRQEQSLELLRASLLNHPPHGRDTTAARVYSPA